MSLTVSDKIRQRYTVAYVQYHPFSFDYTDYFWGQCILQYSIVVNFFIQYDKDKLWQRSKVEVRSIPILSTQVLCNYVYFKKYIGWRKPAITCVLPAEWAALHHRYFGQVPQQVPLPEHSHSWLGALFFKRKMYFRNQALPSRTI